MSSNLARSLVSMAPVLLAVACGDAHESARALSALGPDEVTRTESVQSSDAEPPSTFSQPLPPAVAVSPEAREGAAAPPARNRNPDTRNVAALGAGNRAFAFDLFRQVARSSRGKNVVLSPYSVSSSLAMVFAGARRRTEAEMGATLHFPVGQPAIHDAFNAVALQLAARGGGQPGAARTPFRLNVDNALWVQDGFFIEQPFLDTLRTSYGAAPRSVDFATDPEKARGDINAWVAERTEQLVPELLTPGAVDQSTSLVVTNTVYFNASWQSPFDPSKTVPAPFRKLDGGTASVPMMQASQRLPHVRGENYEAVALPYASEELSLVAVVPDAGAYAAVEDAVDGAWFDQLWAGLRPTQVALAFPKLDYRAHVSLRDQLVALDMRSAFSGADFTGITPEGAALDDVIHEAAIKVFEGGTVAAAATAVAAARSAAVPSGKSVRFDRPFLYAIVDAPTGQILFLGRVLDPSG